MIELAYTLRLTTAEHSVEQSRTFIQRLPIQHCATSTWALLVLFMNPGSQYQYLISHLRRSKHQREMLNCHLSPLHAHHHQTRVLTAMPCEAVEECTFSVHLHMIDCSHSATIVRGTIPCVIMAQQYKIRIAMKLVACPVN